MSDSITIHRPDIVSLLEAVLLAVEEGYTELDVSNEYAPQAFVGMMVCTLRKPEITEKEIYEKAVSGDTYELLDLPAEKLKELLSKEEDVDKRYQLIDALHKVELLEAQKNQSLTRRGRPRNPQRDPGLTFGKK